MENVSKQIETTAIIEVERRFLIPDPNQPRFEFEKISLNELAASIEAVGQLVPVPIRRHPHKLGYYVLVDGERRWRAAGIAGITKMQAYVFDGDEVQLLIQQAVSNFTREGHTPLETAFIIRKLKDKLKLNDKGLAKIFGKSEAWILQHLNLLTLDPQVLALMKSPTPVRNRLPLSTALLLVPFQAATQKMLAREFFNGRVGFKAAKLRIQKLNNKLKQAGQKKTRPYNEIMKLNSFVKTTGNSLEVLLGMHDDVFQKGLRNKPVKYRQEMLEKLSELQTHIEELKAKVQLTIT